MLDSELIKKFCLTRNLELLTHISSETQNFLIESCKVKITKFPPDKFTTIAHMILHFYDTMPRKYKGKIHHLSNTCWIASSFWMAGSAQALLSMLSVYQPSGDEKPLNKNLQFLVDSMNINFPTIESRKFITRPDWNSVLTCLSEHSGYRKGEQDDISKNWDGIVDLIPMRIRKLLFGHNIPKVSRQILDKYSNILDDKSKIRLYKQLVNRYNTILGEVKNGYRIQISKVGDDKFVRNGLIDKVVGSRYDEDIEIQLPEIFSDKDKKLNFWHYAYYLWFGHFDKNFGTFERFCGKARGYNKIIYPKLCELYILSRDIRELQSNYNEKETLGFENWNIVIPTREKSVQNYIKTKLNMKEIIISEFLTYNIRRVKTNGIQYDGKLYISIKINYDMDMMSGNIIIPEKDSFKIEEVIFVGGSKYLLTAVGTKSGGKNSGHWKCLVRDKGVESVYIAYDDLIDIRIYDINFINNFSYNNIPSLLLYSKIF